MIGMKNARAGMNTFVKRFESIMATVNVADCGTSRDIDGEKGRRSWTTCMKEHKSRTLYELSRGVGILGNADSIVTKVSTNAP